MKKHINIMIIGVLALFAGSCSAPNVETKRFVQEREEVVRKATLSNGVSIITKEVGNGVISYSVWFKTGSRTEDESVSGISHFIEHLIFKGSTSGKVNELSKTIEGLGGHLNGATSKDFTYYYYTIASKFSDAAMDGMMDCLINPAFDAAEINKERKVVIEEIMRKQDNPFGYLYEKMSRAAYVTHPYGRPVIGTKEIIGSVSRETLLEYYTKHYGPQNTVIIAVGDFNAKELVEKIKKYYLVKGVVKAEPLTPPDQKADFKAGILEESTKFKQTYAAFSWLGPNAKNTDNYAMDVLSTALGQGMSSRLYREVKDKKQLCHNVSAGFSTMKDEGLFSVYGELEAENTVKFKDAVLEELSKIRKDGLAQVELDKVLTMIENNYIYEHETNEDIGHSLGYYEMISSFRQELTYVDNIRLVTTEDVKRVANKYLAGEPSEVVLKPK